MPYQLNMLILCHDRFENRNESLRGDGRRGKTCYEHGDWFPASLYLNTHPQLLSVAGQLVWKSRRLSNF